MTDLPTDLPVFYQGRLWDAPMTDGAVERDLTGGSCDYCQEPIEADDNALQLPFMLTHLECNLRSGLGSVAHLEGRCICGGGSGDDYPKDQTYREQAKASMEWILTHGRGRFHPEETA